MFSEYILAWFDNHGRKNLPWQQNRNAYTTWLSEIMLQQTQVITVIPYYHRFYSRFPSIYDLAKADIDEVLQYWAGLGYYARARNLYKTANIIVEQYQGEFPQDIEVVKTLAGIGESTAAAILAQAFGQKHAILDANVQRVLMRYYALSGHAQQNIKALWQYAKDLLPNDRMADYTQAMMDLGALLCIRKKPKCLQCPVIDSCLAYQKKLQDHIPQPKPKINRPLKQTTMIIFINNQQEILLEKRPMQGIWGGLWSFPEMEAEKAIDWIEEKYLEKKEILSKIKHDFTHFRLQITPIMLKIKQSPNYVACETRTWYSLDNLPALPKPVQSIINKINLGDSL